ncbi:MAG: T9SS type A sorting domain-containing protein [Cytophagaceae bacterium]
MKKLLLSFFASIVLSAALAQPVIERDKMPPIGFSAPFSATMVFGPNPGPAGADQNWDFSSLTMSPGGTLKILNPASTPNGGDYPSSNYAWELDAPIVGKRYNYYILSADKLESLGDNIGGGDGVKYTDSRVYLTFPLNYNESVDDSYTPENGTPKTSTNHYDAYGTIKTPIGTYNNVARLVSKTDNVVTAYSWYVVSPMVYPVFTIDMMTNFVTAYGTPVITGVNSAIEDKTMNIYPNPASSVMTLTTEKSVSSVIFSDALGKTVSFEVNNSTINVSSLNNGVYTLIVNYTDGTKSSRMFVKN